MDRLHMEARVSDDSPQAVVLDAARQFLRILEADDQVVEEVAEPIYDGCVAWLPDDNRWKYSTNETAKNRARKLARAVLARLGGNDE